MQTAYLGWYTSIAVKKVGSGVHVGIEDSSDVTMPQGEKVYEWEVAEIGDESPPYVYEVTEENIANYSRAVGYENPVYVNDAAAKEVGFPGIFAPPTMVYTYAPQRRHDVMSAKGYIAPEQSRINPRSTPFVSTNTSFQGILVRPGDVVTSTTKVVDKFRKRDNKFITFQVTAYNRLGEKIVQYDYVCLWETSIRRLPQDRVSQDKSHQP